MDTYSTFLAAFAIETLIYILVFNVIHRRYKVRIEFRKDRLVSIVLFKIEHPLRFDAIKTRTGRYYYRFLNRLTLLYYIILFMTISSFCIIMQ